jgi:arabinogalactan endo-1,4-beta-galactosidase
MGVRRGSAKGALNFHFSKFLAGPRKLEVTPKPWENTKKTGKSPAGETEVTTVGDLKQ